MYCVPLYYSTTLKIIFFNKLTLYLSNECMELLEKISTEIKRLRKQKGLSQESLAFKIDIDRKYASLIEKGNTNLSVNYLKKVCEGLDIKLSDFFKNIEE